MSKWNTYLNDRLIRHENGYCVIIPNDKPSIIPISCSVCSFLYKSQEDVDSHAKFQCCYACASTWAYQNQQKWKNGWRPSKEQVSSNIKDRKMSLLECSW